MILASPPDDLTAADLVGALADPHRCFQAYQRLLRLGPAAAAAARDGMRDPEPRVREYCCLVLEHLMDAESVPVLVDALGDPAERVRLAAAHALAGDGRADAGRAGDGRCPDADAVLPRAMDVLARDESAHVRAVAAELVGRWAHSHPAACSAVERAARRDPAPAVRKKAARYAPGGAIYRLTAPRPHRLRPS